MKSKHINTACFIFFLTSISFAQMEMDWVSRYSSNVDFASASGVCVDLSGNIYVTGIYQAASSTFFCTTIKYDKFGNALWLKNYQDPSSHTIGYDIALDSNENVYVAGAAFIIKYNTVGDLIWERYDTCVFYKMLLDSSGNIYAAGNTGGGLKVVKYNSAGVRLWKSSESQVHRVNDLMLDKANNLLIAAVTTAPGSTGVDYNYGTIKFSSSTGNLIWRRTYNGPSFASSPYDYAYAVASDLENNVYVTGASVGLNGYFNCTTIKYDSSGTESWIKRIYPPSNGYDIAVDELQNVYIASMSNGNNYTMKLDSGANILWTRTYPTTYPYSINRNVIFLDSINNVYVSGNSDSISNTSYAALKYDKEGNFKFVVCYGYTPVGFNYVQDMVVDRKGSIYLTGESNRSYATVKFSEIPVGINFNNSIIPSVYKLGQNYPNPFNPTTKINFSIPKQGLVTLKIYDVLGKEVMTLVNEIKSVGIYEVEFDGINLASGAYFYRIEAGEFTDIKRMILIK